MKKVVQRLFVFLASAVVCAAFWGQAVAAKFPEKPITLIVPFAAGNSMDISARIIADYLQKTHNVTLLSTPKPGGSSIPATLEVKAARPDGYTLG